MGSQKMIFRRSITIICLAFLIFSCQDQEPVTFFVVSDTHFGVNNSVESYNRTVIERMNRLPGTEYPDSIEGSVQSPGGVLIPGDLTDHGDPDSWEKFTDLYGLNGEKELKYPVFEGFGNHDGPVEGAVRSGIRKRNTQREQTINVSDNGLHYSWDWDNIHFVNLNSYPSAEWDSTCAWCHYFEESFREPQQSLQFLEQDLSENIDQSNQPIILYFHYGFDEWGYKWWTEAERDAFYETIKPYNVLAIFYGHSHSVQKDRWRGIPVYCVGSTQKEDRPGEFIVVEITDQNMTVLERNHEGWGIGDRVNYK
jgi:cytolysin (calcineurin-like family phosphatase)